MYVYIFQGVHRLVCVHACHLCPGSLPLGGFRTARHTPSTSKCSHSECLSHVVWVVSLLRLSSFKNEITLLVKRLLIFLGWGDVWRNSAGDSVQWGRRNCSAIIILPPEQFNSKEPQGTRRELSVPSLSP